MKLSKVILYIALAVGLLAPGQSLALTILRIGGQDLPAPERADREGVAFIQLAWEETAAGDFGSTRLIEFGGGSIAPLLTPPDLNLTPTIRERGGSIRSSSGGRMQREDQLDNLFDSDQSTVYEGSTGSRGGGFTHGLWDPACSCNIEYKVMVFDLGAPYSIGRIRFGTRPSRAFDRFPRKLTLGISAIDPRKSGRVPAPFLSGGSPRFIGGVSAGYLEFDVLYEDFENTESSFDLAIGQAAQALIFAAPIDRWEIAEFEIYGGGYVPDAGYESDIIDLGGPAIVGGVSWLGEVVPGSRVEISVRSGADEDPNVYWRNTFRGDRWSRFDADGTELTRSDYAKLEGGEKVGITPDKENWEFWTAPADFSAGSTELAATVPTRFAQFKVDFSSSDNAGGRLDFVQFEVTQPPIVSQVIGEIVPALAQLGETTPFTYKMLPTLTEADSGFDSIEITTPIPPAGIDEVRIGSRILGPGDFQVEPYDGRSAILHIPFVDLQFSSELIEIEFRAAVFQVATVFGGRVFDSTRPLEVRQRVAPGDADPLAEGSGLTVRTRRVAHGSIHRLTVSAITPNGDGINELLEIEYDLVNLADKVPVAVEVYDLNGRKVADLNAANGAGGRFATTWDGRNDGGALVPPGLYLVRLSVAADLATDVAVAPVSLVY